MALNEDTPTAEAQRLVADDQPEDNQIEHDSIERKIKFHNLHIAVALGSIALFLHDVTLDWFFAYTFYAADGQHWYASVAITLFVLPGLLASCLSGWWYFGGEQRRQCFPSATRAVWIFRIACHACFLSPLARLVDSLRCSLKCKSALKEKNVDKFRKYDALLVYEDRDATLLRLVQTYLGLAPQLVLRLSAAFAAGEELVWQRAVISGGSVLSLAWALVAFKVTSDLPQDSARRADSPSKLIYGLAHFFGACARFIALAIGAAHFPRSFAIAAIVHWLAMFIYVRSYHRKALSASPFAWDKHPVKDHAAHAFLAAVHTFTFLNLNHYRSKARYLFYFTLCFLENVTLMVCWWLIGVEEHETVHCVLFWLPLVAFVLGLLLLWYSHRCRVTRPAKSVPHETHVNGLHSEEAPLKFDSKEEVCHEVVVVEEPIEKEEAVKSAAIPTGVQIEELTNDEEEQSSAIDEEPIEEKVTEIWFNRAPKRDETTEPGQRAERVTEDPVKRETDIALSAAHTETRVDSEKRADRRSPDSRKSASVEVEQRATGQRQLEEDVEKLLNELGAYEAVARLPGGEPSRAQQVVPSERAERGESWPVNEAHAGHERALQQHDINRDESKRLEANANAPADGSTRQENAAVVLDEHETNDEEKNDSISNDESEMRERNTGEDKPAATYLPTIESCTAHSEDLPSQGKIESDVKEQTEERVQTPEEIEEAAEEEIFEQKTVTRVDLSSSGIRSAAEEVPVLRDENDCAEPLDVSNVGSLSARENEDEKVVQVAADKETEPELEASTQIETVDEAPALRDEEHVAKEERDDHADDGAKSAKLPQQENADEGETWAVSARAETVDVTVPVSQKPHDDESAEESARNEIAGKEDDGQTLQPILLQVDSNHSSSDVNDNSSESNETVTISSRTIEQQPVVAETNFVVDEEPDQTEQAEICEEPVALTIQESLSLENQEEKQLSKDGVEAETVDQLVEALVEENTNAETLQLYENRSEQTVEDDAVNAEDLAVQNDLVLNDALVNEDNQVVESEEKTVSDAGTTQESVLQPPSECEQAEVGAAPQETETPAELVAQPADVDGSPIEEPLETLVLSPVDAVIVEQLDLAIETSVHATNGNVDPDALIVEDPVVGSQEIEKLIVDASADAPTAPSLSNDSQENISEETFGSEEIAQDPVTESREAEEQPLVSSDSLVALTQTNEQPELVTEPIALSPSENREITPDEKSDPVEEFQADEIIQHVESIETEENTIETQSSDLGDEQVAAGEIFVYGEERAGTDVSEDVTVQEQSTEKAFEAETTENVEEEKNESAVGDVAQLEITEKGTEELDETSTPVHLEITKTSTDAVPTDDAREEKKSDPTGNTAEQSDNAEEIIPKRDDGIAPEAELIDTEPLVGADEHLSVNQVLPEDTDGKVENHIETTIVTEESQQTIHHVEPLLPAPSPDSIHKVNEETKQPESIQSTESVVLPAHEESPQQVSSVNDEIYVTQPAEDIETLASGEANVSSEVKPHNDIKAEDPAVSQEEIEAKGVEESSPISDFKEISNEVASSETSAPEVDEAATIDADDQRNIGENQEFDTSHPEVSETSESASLTVTAQAERSESEVDQTKGTAEKPKHTASNDEKKSKFQSRIPRKKP